MEKRPNVVIFNPDEMRLDALGHMGMNKGALTPFIDHFASTEAVSFSSSIVQNPVCVPSRCSMFTGLYPHVRGHRTMAHLLREGEETLFSEMKDQGYYVWMNSRNDLVSGSVPGLFESHATEVFYGGDVPPALGRVDDKAKPGNKYFKIQYGGKLKTDENGLNYSSDDEDVDALLSRFANRKDERPIMGFLGLFSPHCPYQVEDPYYSQIDRSLIKERIKWEDCSGKSKMLQKIREIMDLSDVTEEDWRELRAVYAGMCLKVDNEFRRLVEGLKKLGVYDDTLIIFISDHGDYTGDYGLPEKCQSSFEDTLVRIPFMIKPPKGCKVDPGICSSIVENIDLYATVHDYAGTKPSHTHFSRSLKPLVENRSESVRSFAICEGGRLPEEEHCNEYLQSAGNGKPTSPFSPYYSRHLAQTDDEAHSKAMMIRTSVDKYISRVSDEDEYYDLVADPDEKINLINDPAKKERIKDLQIAAFKYLQATSDIVPFDADSRSTPEMVWAKVKEMVPKEREEEVKRMCNQGMNRFMIIEACRKMKAQNDK